MDQRSTQNNPGGLERSRGGGAGGDSRNRGSSQGSGATREPPREVNRSREAAESGTGVTAAESGTEVTAGPVSQQSQPQYPLPILSATTGPVFEPRSVTIQGSEPPARSYASVVSGTTEIVTRRPRSASTASIVAQTDGTLEAPTLLTQVNGLESLQATGSEPESARSTPENVRSLTEPKAEAEPKAQSTISASRPSEALSHTSTGEAYRAAPPPTSFLSAIAQTQAIRNALARPAPELTNIGPTYSPVPNRASFEKFWAEGRVRPRGFPPTQTASTGEFQAVASTLDSFPRAVAATASATPRSAVPPAASSSASVLSPPCTTVVATSTIPSRVLPTISPPPLPGQGQPLESPTRSARVDKNLSASRIAQSQLRIPARAPLQAATSSFSGSPATTQQLVITPSKTLLKDAQKSTPDSPLDLPDDTPEQKEKIRKAMSSFQDLGGPFETITWDQNQGQANHGDSPEILAVPAQPVASYTTVGSLRPATTPQFTAPNRIQRDGTGRRPLQANFQDRGNDNQLGGRAMNHYYDSGYGSSTHFQFENMNASQYGAASQQQYGTSMQRPNEFMDRPASSMQRPNEFMDRPASSMQRPNEFMDRPASSMQPPYGSMVQHQRGSTSNSGVDVSTQRETRSASPYETTQQGRFGSLAQHTQENRAFVGSFAQLGAGYLNNPQLRDSSSSTGLTDDEMKVLHLHGLSEPTFGSSVPSMRSGNIPEQSRNVLLRNDLSLNPQAQSFNVPSEHRVRGPAQVYPTQNSRSETESEQKNSMQHMARDAASESSGANTRHIALPSRPQLPQQSVMGGMTSHGQAVNNGNIHGNIGFDSQYRGNLDQNYRFPSQGVVHATAGNQVSVSNGQQIASTFGSNVQVTTTQSYGDRSGGPQPLTAGPPGQRQPLHTAFPGMPYAQGTQGVNASNNPNNTFHSASAARIRDTLPPDEVRQYYPNGFPNDMTGQYTRLPTHNINMSAEEAREANTNKWFRSGLAKINMTTNDSIADMTARNAGSNPEQAALLRELQETSEPISPLTIQQINDMSITDVSAQLTGPLFGSLLRIADQRPGPNNLGRMSRFGPAPEGAIDNSPNGNRSFFSENPGPRPPHNDQDPPREP